MVTVQLYLCAHLLLNYPQNVRLPNACAVSLVYLTAIPASIFYADVIRQQEIGLVNILYHLVHDQNNAISAVQRCAHKLIIVYMWNDCALCTHFG